jgi:hypothetical protein
MGGRDRVAQGRATVTGFRELSPFATQALRLVRDQIRPTAIISARFPTRTECNVSPRQRRQ